MATVIGIHEPSRRIARELSEGVVLLGLTGSCFGGLVGMLAIATRALGR
jgi:hypothetical protein